MKRLFPVLLALLVWAPAFGQLKLGASTDNLLEPEAAFRFSAHALEGSAIEVAFAIADGYYLYRDRFRFSAEGNRGVRLGAPQFPRGLKHKDEFFGEVETYRKEVRIRIPVEGDGRFDLKVVSQGCADAGVCYVPMESKASLRLDGSGETAAPRFSVYASDIDIARLFEGNFAIVLGGFLLFGLLLTFTPCVLPMIPILSGIIAGEGAELNKLRALALSLSYVLGMAIAYAAA
ncbi:MAG TPA: protein-disulfide reductase DsbD domain-containing protein, partial [Burkholderiales bacterium]|nr:protein-disulfide reductase DsbD domain-containing protein [Burkholderiales bacterium]